MRSSVSNTQHLIRMSLDKPQFSAKLDLVYVSDSEKGIERIRKGKKFKYFLDGKLVKDKILLARIHSLVIPPAWQKVWICVRKNGHLQATGLDAKNRKQYIYHDKWSSMRNQTKFFRLHDFGKQLPALRRKVEADLSRRSLTEAKVIATVVRLMEYTYIRIGNAEYERQNGSYGLTTLKDNHVSVKNNSMVFLFKGKSGIRHKISIHNKRLARIVKECRDIPGKELFQYYDKNGEVHAIDSGKVNAYLNNISGFNFTAKDFRTWAGSLNALRAFKNLEEANDNLNSKGILTVLDYVSHKLGNTRAVCKKYYVHPALFSLFEKQQLDPYLKLLDRKQNNASKTGLNKEEKVLLKIIKRSKIYQIHKTGYSR